MSKFLDGFLASQHSMKAGRRKDYGFAVRAFEKAAGQPFDTAYKDKVVVHRALSVLGGRLSDCGCNNYLACYKRLAKWLSDPDDVECPKLWRMIQRKKIDWNRKLKDKWLSEEEFWRILNVTDHPRDKAMWCVAVAGGLRPGELLGLKIGDCKPTTSGFKITVSGKTGTRPFDTHRFAPALVAWLSCHPDKNNKDSPLWVRRRAGRYGSIYHPIGFGIANRTFKVIARRAGIRREVSLGILRHTKITWTYRQGKVRVSDEMARKMFGWSKNSSMPSRYAHLFGVDTENVFLALDGVEKPDSKPVKPSVLTPKKCLRCGESNSFDALYCRKCATVLDPREAAKIVERQKKQERIMELLGRPGFLEMLEKAAKAGF